MAEAKRRIYVPQVVQVRWDTAAETSFRTPRVYAPDDVTSNLVYSADYAGNSDALMAETIACLQAYYPTSVNIRFTPFYSTSDTTTKFLFLTPDIRKAVIIGDDGKRQEVNAFGTTSPNSLQRRSIGSSTCYLGSIFDTTLHLYTEAAKKNKPRPFPIPVSSSQMLEAISKVSAHEVGHALGLVDTYCLDGVGDGHNPEGNVQMNMMNVSTDLEWMFNSHSPITWRELNLKYLEFVLPVP